MLSPGGLTGPERELLSLVAAGHQADRIAELLQTSRYAVEHRKRRIYAKLHAVNQSHAIARAAALGIVDRPVAAHPGGPPTTPAGRAAGGALVVLRGPAGPARQRVTVALLSRQLAFAVAESARPAGTEPWTGWGDRCSWCWWTRDRPTGTGWTGSPYRSSGSAPGRYHRAWPAPR